MDLELEKIYIAFEAQTQELKKAIDDVNAKVDGMGKKAKAASDKLAASTTAAAKKTSKSFGTMGKAIIAAFSVRAVISFFNRFLELTKQTENFRKSLAVAFQPLITTLQPFMNSIILAVARLAAFLSGLASAFIPASEGSKDIKNNLDGSVKAAKQLAGFDEINNLSDEASGSALPTGGVSLISTEEVDKLSAMGKALGEISKWLLLIAGIAAGLYVLDTLGGYFMNAIYWASDMIGHVGPLPKLLESLWIGFEMLGEKIIIFITPLTKATLGISLAQDGIGALITGMAGAAAIIALVVAAFVDLWNTSSLFKQVFEGIFIFIQAVAIGLFASVIAWIQLLWEIVGRIATALYELYENSLKPVVEVLFYLAGAVAALMAGAFGVALEITINAIGAALSLVLGLILLVVEAFNSLFKAIADGNPWAIALGGILLGIVTPAIIAATTALWGMFAALVANTAQLIKQIVQWGLQAAATIASTIATAAATVGAWLFNAALWANPITWVIAGIVALIAIFVWAYKEFEVFRNQVNGLWDSMKSGFKGFINFFIDGINSMIKALNGFKFTLPDWVPLIGGKGFSVNIPLIPRFADGGMPSTGSLFIANEAGPELVGSIGGRTAVMNNDQIVSAVAQGVAAAVASVMGGNEGGDVILNVDGMTLGKVAIKNINKVQRNTALKLEV